MPTYPHRIPDILIQCVHQRKIAGALSLVAERDLTSIHRSDSFPRLLRCIRIHLAAYHLNDIACPPHSGLLLPAGTPQKRSPGLVRRPREGTLSGIDYSFSWDMQIVRVYLSLSRAPFTSAFPNRFSDFGLTFCLFPHDPFALFRSRARACTLPSLVQTGTSVAWFTSRENKRFYLILWTERREDWGREKRERPPKESRRRRRPS